MQIVLNLPPQYVRALEKMTERHNQAVRDKLLPGPELNAQQFAQMRAAGYLAAMFQDYVQDLRDEFLDKFNKADPARQAEILAILGVEIPK